jgi:hypothetical protein
MDSIGLMVATPCIMDKQRMISFVTIYLITLTSTYISLRSFIIYVYGSLAQMASI